MPCAACRPSPLRESASCPPLSAFCKVTGKAGGTYSLSTHAGDVVVKVPLDASVAISASTFGGAFETAFPVTLQKAESGGRTVTLSLGDGGARMELQSFGGTIRLERP